MSIATKIEWTRATWTPIRARVRADAKQIAQAKGYKSLLPILDRVPAGKVGPHCEHVSPGCEHCYSETGNGRCLPNNGTGLPFDRRVRDLVDIFIDEEMLCAPLKWRKARKVFVCSQTDLFADFVTDEMIDRVFAMMALCPQHTFQVLTKRSERMRRYFHDDSLEDRLTDLWAGDDPNKQTWNLMLPLKNVHLGVSVENQEYADKRIPDLLATPAAVRWVSYEPALGPVDWTRIARRLATPYEGVYYTDALRGAGYKPSPLTALPIELECDPLGWIVIGGESGGGARPFDIAWARQTIEQCKAAGVPVFCKQLGAKPQGPCQRCNGRGTVDRWLDGMPGQDECPQHCYGSKTLPLVLKDRKGGNIAEFPKDLRVREYPHV